MSDKIKSVSVLPEMRVMLFVLFGIGLWLFLVGGIAPTNIGLANANESASAVVTSSEAEALRD